MNKKNNTLFFALAAVVIAFILGIFISQAKIFKPDLSVYGLGGEISRIGPDQAAGALKTANHNLKTALTDLRSEHETLLSRYDRIKEEKESLDDIVASLDIDDKALAPLKQKIKDVSCMVDNIEEHARSSEHLGSLLDSIYGELSAIELSMAKMAHDAPFYEDKLEEKDNEIEDRQKEIEQLRENILDLEAKFKKQSGFKNEILKYRKKFEALDQERTGLKDKIAKEKETLKRMSSAVNILEKEKQELLKAEAENKKKLKKYEIDISRLGRERETLNSDLVSKSEKIKNLDIKIKDLEKEKQFILAEKNRLESRNAGYKTSIKELKEKAADQASALAEYKEYKDKYTALHKAHESLKEKADQDRAVLARLSQQVNDLISEKESLESAGDKYAREIKEYKLRALELSGSQEAAKRDLSSNKEEIDRLNREVSVLRAENKKYAEKKQALEETLADYASKLKTMSAQVKENENAFTQLDEYKEKLRELRSAQAELEAVSVSDKAELNSLRARIGLLEQEQTAFTAREKETEKKIESFKSLIAQLSREKEDLSAQAAEFTSRIAALSGELKNITAERDTYLKTKTGLEEKISQDSSLIVSLRTEIEELRTLFSEIEKKQADTSLKVTDLEEANASLLKEKEDMDRQIKKITAELEEKTSHLSVLEKELALSRVEYERANAQYSQASKTIERIGLDLANRADKIVGLQEKLEDRTSALAEVKGKLEVKLKEMALLREDMVKIKLENTRLSGAMEDKEASLVYLRQEIRRISDINSQFRASLHRVSNVIDENEETFAAEDNDISFVSDLPQAEEPVDVEINTVLPEEGAR